MADVASGGPRRGRTPRLTRTGEAPAQPTRSRTRGRTREGATQLQAGGLAWQTRTPVRMPARPAVAGQRTR